MISVTVLPRLACGRAPNMFVPEARETCELPRRRLRLKTSMPRYSPILCRRTAKLKRAGPLSKEKQRGATRGRLKRKVRPLQCHVTSQQLPERQQREILNPQQGIWKGGPNAHQDTAKLIKRRQL